MSTTAFLADDDGEARFSRVPGFELSDYFELADLMNAFTVLVHQEAGRDSAGSPGAGAAKAVSHSRGRDPDEILAATSLAQIVLTTGSSNSLRQALSRSTRFGMSAAEFMQADDGEAMLRDAAGLNSTAYIELSDLVNAFAMSVFERRDG